MIFCRSEGSRYKTVFSNGSHEACADTTADKGGVSAGFRPHDLLEAALASCLNMSLRMCAEINDISFSEIRTKVALNRAVPDKVAFEYSFEVDGTLTNEQHEILQRAAESCPVRRTLSGEIYFHGRISLESQEGNASIEPAKIEDAEDILQLQ